MVKLNKQLYRSRSEKIFEGVLGGLAIYFELDVNLLRMAFLILTCFTGFIPGLIAYIATAMIIPKEPLEKTLQGEPS